MATRVLVVEEKYLDHPKLEKGDRSRMKILGAYKIEAYRIEGSERSGVSVSDMYAFVGKYNTVSTLKWFGCE